MQGTDAAYKYYTGQSLDSQITSSLAEIHSDCNRLKY